MNDLVFINALRLYLLRKQRLNNEIAKVRLEYQRLLKNYRRNRNLQHQLISSILLIIDGSLSFTRRSIWSFKKSKKWWTNIVPFMNDKQFKENFRVERSTFLSLVNQIGPSLEKSNTNYRTAIPVEQRIACALYTLGSSSELRTISHLFGIGRSTAREILHEFCSVVVQSFFKRFIKFPSSPREIQTTINGFQDKFNYPVCIGALDGTHIPIKPPLGLESDYYNFKKYHSVIMLATVNSDLLFTYINIGAPGRCNDASIFNRCILSEVIEDPIYSNYFIMVNNTKIQSHLIADSAFALSTTVLKPFADRADIPKCHSNFNYRLSRARSSVERAFGALKNRFRILHKKIEFKLSNTTNIIKTAAILHNLCVVNNDHEEIDWNIPVTIHKKPACNSQTNDGANIRQALVNYFVANPL